MPHLRTIAPLVAVGILLSSASAFAQEGRPFRRGDANTDGRRDISDAVQTLSFLFRGGPESNCQDAADTNDDGAVDISDAVWLIWFLFAGAAPPPPPGGICGNDPTIDGLGCESYAGCEGEDFVDFVTRLIRDVPPASEPSSINDRVFVFRDDEDAYDELLSP